MRSVEKYARTVEEAVEEALRELELSKEQVEIEVIDEGSKGLFGLLGSKQARVLVKPKDLQSQKVQTGAAFLQGLLDQLDAKVTFTQGVLDDGTIVLTMEGQNLGLVIGHRGQMLDAMQYLVNVVANKGSGDWVRIVLDAEGYRQRREKALYDIAQRMADKAKAQGQKVALEPMNAAERRIIHMALADDTQVETASEGEDPYRRVVVIPVNS